jgi:hypothetical protein
MECETALSALDCRLFNDTFGGNPRAKSLDSFRFKILKGTLKTLPDKPAHMHWIRCGDEHLGKVVRIVTYALFIGAEAVQLLIARFGAVFRWLFYAFNSPFVG